MERQYTIDVHFGHNRVWHYHNKTMKQIEALLTSDEKDPDWPDDGRKVVSVEIWE